ncbi:MAG TPA: FHA domain-containing protein, partial [Polyangiaceae bacterium]|nr:FHA domain-containing protein [Polyangiaceae bacterium]
MWLLTIEDHEGTTTSHELSGDRCTLGRAPDSDVLLAQYNVSRRHARLECVSEQWFFFDEGSDNGSYVNGRRVFGPTPMNEGDVAQLGEYVVRLMRDYGVSEPPPPRPAAPARLRGLAGLLAGSEYTFRRSDLVTIGSGEDCALRLEHEGVAPLHALVRALPGGRYEIVDKVGEGSLFVNGRPVVGEQVLEGGDSINVAGVALLRYLEPSQVPDPRFDQCLSANAPVPSPAGPDSEGTMPRALLVASFDGPWSSGAVSGPSSAPGSAPSSLPGAGLLVTPATGSSVLNRVPDVGGEWDVTGLFRTVMGADGLPVVTGGGDGGGEGEGAPEGERESLLPARRFVSAGPMTPPVPRPLPASYLRLRQTTTPSRGIEGKGRGQAAAAVRRALEQADEGLAELQRWQPGARSLLPPDDDGRGPADGAPDDRRLPPSSRPTNDMRRTSAVMLAGGDIRRSLSMPAAARRTSLSMPADARRGSLSMPADVRRTSLSMPADARRAALSTPTETRRTSLAMPADARRTSLSMPADARR